MWAPTGQRPSIWASQHLNRVFGGSTVGSRPIVKYGPHSTTGWGGVFRDRTDLCFDFIQNGDLMLWFHQPNGNPATKLFLASSGWFWHVEKNLPSSSWKIWRNLPREEPCKTLPQSSTVHPQRGTLNMTKHATLETEASFQESSFSGSMILCSVLEFLCSGVKFYMVFSSPILPASEINWPKVCLLNPSWTNLHLSLENWKETAVAWCHWHVPSYLRIYRCLGWQ